MLQIGASSGSSSDVFKPEAIPPRLTRIRPEQMGLKVPGFSFPLLGPCEIFDYYMIKE
jgi:hypothetical protein